MDWVFVFLCGCLLGWGAAHLRPSALLHCVRAAWRAWWRWKSRRRGGRPRIARELRDLIARMSRENPLWGAPRVHGELLKLGFRVAQSTVAKYMVRRSGGGGQSWKTFLHNHRDAIAAIDMLTVPTLGFEQLYAFVVLGLGRRAILHIEVTDHPTAFWLAQQITEAFPWDSAPRFLVRDNDGAYGQVFRRRLWAMGIRDRPTTPHSPWQNGYAERAIGSIRRECLDHLIIFDAAHLRRVLRRYVEYYNFDRTHRALDKDSPMSRPVETDGEIVSRPILGGLHHRYARIPSKWGFRYRPAITRRCDRRRSRAWALRFCPSCRPAMPCATEGSSAFCPDGVAAKPSSTLSSHRAAVCFRVCAP
jgi:transposase InsO family protein